MPVTIETQNTGDTNLQRDLAARIEQVFANRPGDWRIVILGSKASDRWDMKITGRERFRAILHAGRRIRPTSTHRSRGDHFPDVADQKLMFRGASPFREITM